MGVTRHPYEVPGWGVGEVWLRDGTVIQHELACEALRHAQEAMAGESRPIGVELTAPDPGPAGVTGGFSVPPNGGARLPARTLPPESSPDRVDCVPELCRRIAAHLAGVPVAYDDIPIDLDWATPLQQDLAAAARAIPWGEVVSYGELAALAGRPGAARAAGSFCAENRFSLIVPCHRVVAATGIGGYGLAGPELKRRLLALEGVTV